MCKGLLRLQHLALAACLVGAIGCAELRGLIALPPAPSPSPDAEAGAPAIERDVYERAEAERSDFFEREVERLRADLRQAEESIIALESGLRHRHSRADAVSAVAEARIALDRVGSRVPWRSERVAEAYGKLADAERQLEAGHLGAAMFFASRAQRIADSLRHEARQVAMWSERRVIHSARVNLRAGPSLDSQIVRVLLRDTPVFPERIVEEWQLVRTPDGRVGWVHASLLVRP